MRYIILLSTLIFIIFLASCSGADPVTPSGEIIPGQNIQSSSQTGNGHSLLGLFRIDVDPSTLTASITPAREISFHANIRKFLENGPCTDCLSLEPPIVPKPYGIDVTVGITHPFPGLSQYIGFDVRGIVMFEGDYEFPEYGITTTRAAAGGWGLRNHDGFTVMFNANYTQPGILGYQHGSMIPPSWPNPPNELNAFMAYYSDGQSENDGGRRAFLNSDHVSRTYEIQVESGEPFYFWYAIDASWQKSSASGQLTPDDFPISANCPEPFRFDFSVVSGELWDVGGSVEIGMDVWDHQGWKNQLYEYYVEAPDCTDALQLVSEPPLIIDGKRAHFQFTIDNWLNATDPEFGAEMLVVFDNPDDDLFNGEIDGFGRFTIPVGECSGPVLIDIDPDHGLNGDYLSGVELTGVCFEDGADVWLETFAAVMFPENIQYVNASLLTFDLDLTGAPYGTYEVWVENPDGQSATGVDFEVTSESECNDVIHTDIMGWANFGGGTNMAARDASFVHNTGQLSDGYLMGYISGFAGTVVTTYYVDDLFWDYGPGLGGGWGNPIIGSWPTPEQIDISEEMGRFFVIWDLLPTHVQEWTYDGIALNDIDVSWLNGNAGGLDTDGFGGFWVSSAGFFDLKIRHYVPNTAMSFSEEVDDRISMSTAWGAVEDIICIPDEYIFVLAGSNNGKIRGWDISVAPPVQTGEVFGIFSGPLSFGNEQYDRPCDFDIDWSDPAQAPCRILVWGNVQGAGGELVKIDADLNILAGPVSVPGSFYNSMVINPEEGHVTLWPERGSGGGGYKLIELPSGW